MKKRSGIYIRKDIKYRRRIDHKKVGYHIVVIDVILEVQIHVVSLYRSFRPEGLSPIDFFMVQLEIVKNLATKNLYVMGDFNLDAGIEGRQDYSYKNPLELLSNFSFENNLLQVVNFNTSKRIITGAKKESCLNHI